MVELVTQYDNAAVGSGPAVGFGSILNEEKRTNDRGNLGGLPHQRGRGV
jgi:hypothetical protein